jgi:hypothetical protein
MSCFDEPSHPRLMNEKLLRHRPNFEISIGTSAHTYVLGISGVLSGAGSSVEQNCQMKNTQQRGFISGHPPDYWSTSTLLFEG